MLAMVTNSNDVQILADVASAEGPATIDFEELHSYNEHNNYDC